MGVAGRADAGPTVGAHIQLRRCDRFLQSGLHGLRRQHGIVDRQRQFGGRTDQMPAHDIRIVGIDHGRLRAAPHQLLGVVDEKLVQGVLSSHQHHGRLASTASDPSTALPGGHHRSRVSHQKTQIEAADIDAQLQGTGGNHRQQLPGSQFGLDLPAFFGQKTGSVSTDAVGKRAGAMLGPHRQQLDQLARLGIDDGPNPARQGRLEQRQGSPQGPVGRIQQYQMPATRPGPGFTDGLDRQSGQPAGQFVRIGNRGRGEHERGGACVVAADALQASENLGHVRPQDAAIGVDLVDHHEAQSAQQTGPAVVIGQNAQVNHLRVGQQDVGRVVTDFLAPVTRGVAVVDLGPQVGIRQMGGHGSQRFELVLGQRFQGVDEQGAGARVLTDGLDHRQGVGQGLAGGGPGRGHGVNTGTHPVDDLGLMGVKPIDRHGLEQPGDLARPGLARGFENRRLGSQIPVPDHLPVKSGGAFQGGNVFADGIARNIRVRHAISHRIDLLCAY